MALLKQWRLALVMVIILQLTLVSGCMEKIQSESSLAPLYPEKTEESFYPISFQEGINLLNALFSNEGPTLNKTMPLYYFRGKGVNKEGKAEQWILGTEYDQNFYFVIVESNRQVLIPFQGEHPRVTVDIQKIILPDQLISKNRNGIAEAFFKNRQFSLIDVEMKNNVYSLTSSTDTMKKILYFDAYNGVPIYL
ncbi:MAG: hypothetical protein NQU46_04925 [Methanolinea sp.]|nr:hypothetical protein [Methanolinea sp.]